MAWNFISLGRGRTPQEMFQLQCDRRVALQNIWLNRLVADLSLDNAILKKPARGNF